MIKKFILSGLDCPNCAAKIEKDISSLEGVSKASVNLFTEKLVIDAEDCRMSEIIAFSEKIVKKYEAHVIMRKA